MEISEEVPEEKRRRAGWTWTKEIIGTIIGVLSVTTPFALWLFSWVRGVETEQAAQKTIIAVHTLELTHLKEQRTEILVQLREMAGKIDVLLLRSTSSK